MPRNAPFSCDRGWTALAVLLLAAQVVGLAVASAGGARYLAWAPFHSLARYRLAVQTGGRTLSSAEALARYRLATWYADAAGNNWELNGIDHVQSVIQHYETTYARDEAAEVVLHFRTNGAPERTWTWPR